MLEIKIITTIVKTGIATDCIPVARPDIITVAGPVSPSFAIFLTGPVSYTHLRAHETPEHRVLRVLV